MAKKDFLTGTNTNRLYDSIAMSTGESNTAAVPGTAEAPKKPRKERVKATEEEQAEQRATMRTQGHKDSKLKRMNMAFSDTNYDYIRTMAAVRGENMTEFVNNLVTDSRERNQETYLKALEFRKSF